jgi:ATP-dependent Clp protease ATP-binding subunit ClpA
MNELDVTEADFDTDAMALIAAAQQGARTLGHGYVGTEHFLLAAARLTPELRTTLAAHGSLTPDRLTTELQRIVAENPDWLPYVSDDVALAAIGVDGPAVRDQAREEFGDLFTPAPEGPWFTPRVAGVLTGAVSRAREAGRLAAPVDLVVGVLAGSGGVAHQVLAQLGCDTDVLLGAVRGR